MNTIITMTSMSSDEARQLTDEIRTTANRLHILLLQAHEREAWRALGYASWAAYVQVEFSYSKAHAFRLLSHARKVRELHAAAGAESPVGDCDIPEGVTRQITPETMPVVVSDIRDRVAAGDAPDVAIRWAVLTTRLKLSRTRNRGDQPSRWISSLAAQMESLAEEAEDTTDAELDRVDATIIASCLDEMRQGHRALGRLIRRLETRAQACDADRRAS